MVKIENDCIGCETCVNCGAKDTPHYYCDLCKEETDELYWLEDRQVCDYCLRKELRVGEEEYV